MGLRKRRDAGQDFFPWGFRILDGWLQVKNRGGSLAPYFADNAFRSIAIYGMGAIGRRLFEELGAQGVEVAYAIDRNAPHIRVGGLEVKAPSDRLPAVDAVVVTPIAFSEIEKMLYEKMGEETNVVSIEDIVDYCLRAGEGG